MNQLQCFLQSLLLIAFFHLSYAGSKSKPHSHQGQLQPYDGKHISYDISIEESEDLAAGKPVSLMNKSIMLDFMENFCRFY
jgi:hypothetical protein